MDFSILSIPALAIIVIASLLLLVTRDHRWSIFALAFEFLGGAILISLSWSLEMAASVLIAGWASCIILIISIAEASPPGGIRGQDTKQITPSGSVFRLLSASLVVLTVISLAPQISKWLPGNNILQIWGSIYLVLLGVLMLGLSILPFRVTIALLTILLGFEIIYAGMESAILVAGLLAGVNVGLALIGAYTVVSPLMGDPG